MADNYYFELDDGGVTIIVVDELGPINTWRSTPFDNCLIVPSGVLDSSSDDFICKAGHSNNEPIITLYGAGWDSEVGDTGSAKGHLVSGCSPSSWTLVRKE